MTTMARPFIRRESPLALLIDSAASRPVVESLRAQSLRVETITSVAAVFERPYRPCPDFIVLMNNLPDGTWLAALLASAARWRWAITVVVGSGKVPLALTRSETDVLRRLGSGATTNAAIAEDLCMTRAGVQSAISGLKNKLGFRRAKLVAFAYSLGLFAAQAAQAAADGDGRA